MIVYCFIHSALSTQHTAHSTQHTAHSTQHTALSTPRTVTKIVTASYLSYSRCHSHNTDCGDYGGKMKQKFSNQSGNFLQRRYAVRLGRRYVLAAASVVLLGMIGCQATGNANSIDMSSPIVDAAEPISQKSVKPDTQLIAANTKFGFKLFSQINTDNAKNVFVSPSSVAIALAMTYNGADGSTKQAMAKTLELQNISLERINQNYATLRTLLENPDENVQLNIANSLWANQDANLKPDFLQRNRNFYKAQVTNLNFADADAPNIINSWVNQNTRGKISKIVEKIPPEQALFLVNAIYFKGNWTKEFDKNQTAEHQFFLSNGTQKQHSMMSQSGNYKYYENEQFQAISLPYGKAGKVSLYVFLPKPNSNLRTFYQNLNVDNWDVWMSQLKNREGFIRLPRFKMDYDIKLNEALKALGMGEAFTNQANFSGIGNNLTLSEVKHKTFVELNEEGTEAAAATGVGIMPTSIVIKPTPFKMIVERPFFCAIRDNQTGSILFMGSIVDPQS